MLRILALFIWLSLSACSTETTPETPQAPVTKTTKTTTATSTPADTQGNVSANQAKLQKATTY